MIGPEIDLGLNHAIALVTWGCHDEFENTLYGAKYWHLTPAGVVCEGFIMFNNMANLVSQDPITISPSLLCLSCGDHGFIRDGKWVPA
jgi:hypothetical protein